ncbi:MAG: HAD hydrolase-like protein [Pseudobdellovibrionaceae bacterium]|nr:HAD hydrolase-like protein [Pseudobdellovibrionaceae bacterium]
MSTKLTYKFGIFDWNGTLIDDSYANLAGSNATLRLAGVSELTMETYRDTMDFPLIHFYNRNGVDTDTYLANVGPFGEAFFIEYQERSKTALLREGAMETLDLLLDNGLTMMVLSNHIQGHLEEQMATLHIHHKFKHISGNTAFDKSQITKMNKLDRLKRIMEEHDYRPEESFIIGDSLEEPEIARSLGMTSISVTWGCFSRKRLEASKTHYIIDQIQDLVGILWK